MDNMHLSKSLSPPKTFSKHLNDPFNKSHLVIGIINLSFLLALCFFAQIPAHQLL
jgi:hypothetical protein